MFPAVAVAPPRLYGAHPSYTHGPMEWQFSLEEQSWCSVIEVLNTHHWLHQCAGAVSSCECDLQNLQVLVHNKASWELWLSCFGS